MVVRDAIFDIPVIFILYLTISALELKWVAIVEYSIFLFFAQNNPGLKFVKLPYCMVYSIEYTKYYKMNYLENI